MPSNLLAFSTLRLGVAPLLSLLVLGTPSAPRAATHRAPRPVLARRAPLPTRADTARALHLLLRATYGPTAADLAELLRIGRAAWLERQLHPERIDDTALEARLAGFPVAAMSPSELIAAFPPQRRDPQPRARRDSLAMQAQGERMAPRADSAGLRPERRARRNGANRAPRPAMILAQLASARVQCAVYSQRQLEEVMTAFWFDHFNVFFGKNQDRYLVGDYERSAIRPHVFGRFRDLLGATAHHPAMLVYLDNVRSSAPESEGMDGAPPAPGRPQRPRGLNENYARELMELHTLGVDGGYTQHDVVEVARALTGWSVDRGERGGGEPRFVFRPRLHDAGEKLILGQRFPAGGGEEEGERVLDLLARSPATAHHVALALAQRFVADDPPPALVQRLEQSFLRSGGDLRELTRTLFTSPELDDPRYAGSKVKTPLEFVASALRTTGAELGSSRMVIQTLRSLGELPYFASPPTGYPETSDSWANSGAMLARMNFALALAAGSVDGVRLPPSMTSGSPSAEAGEVARLAARVLPQGADPSLFATIAAYVRAQPGADDAARQARALGLLLGSPAFQRH